MLGENEALQMSIFIFWVLVCARQIIATSNQAIILSFMANARQKTESLNSSAFSLLKAPPLAASKKRKACAGQALLKRFSMFLFLSSLFFGRRFFGVGGRRFFFGVGGGSSGGIGGSFFGQFCRARHFYHGNRRLFRI